ncbi:MAG: hypothetical protein U1E95_04940 [Rubrivivax sp.]
MKYADLRDFIGQLEQAKKLVRCGRSGVNLLEMTAICDRVL